MKENNFIESYKQIRIKESEKINRLYEQNKDITQKDIKNVIIEIENTMPLLLKEGLIDNINYDRKKDNYIVYDRLKLITGGIRQFKSFEMKISFEAATYIFETNIKEYKNIFGIERLN